LKNLELWLTFNFSSFLIFNFSSLLPGKTLKFNQVILIGLLIFLVAISLSVKYQNVVTYLFSDEAVYYMMAQSLAFDRDITYTNADLVRFYEDWRGGPQGVFLTRVVRNGEEKIYYAKPFLYPLFLTPFVYLFGLQGFLVFNSLLLVSTIMLGYLYLKKYNSEQIALLFSMTFFVLATSFVYTFWSTPEVFHMFLIAAGLFLLFYETPVQSQGRKYMSAFLLALATLAKPYNGIFLLPALIGSIRSRNDVYVDRRREIFSGINYAFQRYKHVLGVGITFLLVIGILCGAQYLVMGQWNAYAGDRKTFYGHFPLESSNAEFTNLGTRQTNDVYFEESFYFNPKVFVYNLFYYVFGRFTGILPYFFPALVALFCFGITLSPSLTLRASLLFVIGISILIYIVWAPSNYHGGSGAIGNRFFMNIYPAFLFLVTRIPGFGTVLTAAGVSVLFLAQVLINPFYSSYNPSVHAFRFPFRMLPVELTLVNALPTNVSPRMTQNFSVDPPSYDLYFLDDNNMGRTPEGFWVRGGANLEAVLKVSEEPEDLLLILENGPFENTVDVEVADKERIIRLSGDERREIIFSLEKDRTGHSGFPFFKSYLYPISIKSHMGFIPRFVYQAGSGYFPHLLSLEEVKRGTDYLGCLAQISLNPARIGIAYQKNGDANKAISYLERALEREPENIGLYLALGDAYQETGQFVLSRTVLEEARSLIPNYVASFNRSMEKVGARLEPLPSQRNDKPIENGDGVIDSKYVPILSLIPDIENKNTKTGRGPTRENGVALDTTCSSCTLESLREFVTRRFEAEDLQRTTGSISSDGEASGGKVVSNQTNPQISEEQAALATLKITGETNSQETSSRKGFLTYGPFKNFPAGSYLAKYRLKRSDPAQPVEMSSTTSLQVTLDVQSSRYGVLAKRFLQETSFISSNVYQDFSFSFVNPENFPLEFRVEISGTGTLSVDKIDVYPLLPFQISYLIGTSYTKEGDWQGALSEFLPLYKADPDYPNLVYSLALVWAKSKNWDEALKVLQRNAQPHEGIRGSLYEVLKGDGIPTDEPFYKYLTQHQESVQPQVPVSINFDNYLAFIGYDLSATRLKPSEVLPITYYWKALNKMNKSYAIFVHFSKKKLSSSDFIRKVKQKLGMSIVDFFQQDHLPLQGSYTTNQWLPGEIIKESYQVQVPSHLESGAYEIWVGVWDPKDTGKRLKAEGRDKIKIGEIEIER
jgi:tetratricopeptide (TPR) repeat protein